MKIMICFILALSVSCNSTAQAEEPGGSSLHESKAIAWSQAAFDQAGIKPGDVVVVKNGIYRDARVVVAVDATATTPLTIRAETPGGVILTGNSSLSIGGASILVSGFHFKDCDVPAGDAIFNFRASPKTHASHSRLDNCIFSGSGQSENKDKEIKWVSVYGVDNEISRCSFLDKQVLGSLLVVWVDAQVASVHRIHGNYFTHPLSLKENGSAINGQEMIRIGTSAVSMSAGRCEVYDNYFYRCNGEVECISNKSCDNLYRNNVFDACQSTLTLRHGNDCVVDGNYFFGHKIANTGGVRIIGERHQVFNNYFEELGGDDQRSAISLVRGVENSKLYEYFQVKDAEVTFNTIVNCKSGIVANTGNTTSTMPVMGSRIACNVVMNNLPTQMKGILLNPIHSPEIIWMQNWVYGVSVSGVSDAEIVVSQGFDLIRDGELYVLSPGMIDYKKQIGFDYVSSDIRGVVRPEAKTPGANELSGNPKRVMPTPHTTGATWQPAL